MRHSFLLLVCLLLTGCFGKTAPAPVIDYGAGEGAGSAGVHIVDEGDTAYDIAKRYDVPLRDLLDKNALAPPYNLDPGDRLFLPPPNYYEVRESDTLYSISNLFEVSVTELARTNDLRSPYTIHSGERLKLPYQGRGNTQIKSAVAGRSSSSSVKQASVSKKAVKPPKDLRPPARSSSRFQWPVNGRVISRYGPKKGGLHNDGINISGPRGAPVRVAENGVVLYQGDALEGYGNLVLVKHSGGYVTAYAHLDRVLVKKGQQLKVGQTVGTLGSTGQVDKPQLHFEIRKGSKALNPSKYLGSAA